MMSSSQRRNRANSAFFHVGVGRALGHDNPHEPPGRALGHERHHDLDFIVSQADAPALRNHLVSHKLRLTHEQRAIEQNYGGAWERWEGGARDVTVARTPAGRPSAETANRPRSRAERPIGATVVSMSNEDYRLLRPAGNDGD